MMTTARPLRSAFAILAATALTVTTPTASSHGEFAPGGGYGMMQGHGMTGPGMMHSDVMGAGCALGGSMMSGMLELSKDQREKLAKIESELRREQWATMGKVIERQSSLQDLLDADEPDPQQVADAYAHVAALRGEMIAAAIAARNRMRGLLDDEQRARVDEWRRGRWPGAAFGGPASGMGPGMMAPGMMHPGMMGPGMM